MTDLATFLQAVLPPDSDEHEYWLAAPGPGGGLKDRTPHTSPDALADAAVPLLAAGTASACLAAFVPGARPTGGNVAALRTWCLDIEVGDGGYPSLRAAGEALAGAVQGLGVPEPTVVFSGRGLHAYWPGRTAVPAKLWHRGAEVLRRAAQAQGLLADWQPTGSAVHPMRLPGALNAKSGKRAAVLRLAAPVDAEEFVEALARAAATADQPTAKPRERPAAVVGDFRRVAEGCAQVAAMVEERATLPEPDWYSLLGVIYHCESSAEVAKIVSRSYEGYSEGETLAKMSQWGKVKGPPLCTSIEARRPGGCDGCPLRGYGASPIHAGPREVQLTMPAPETGLEVSDVAAPEPWVVNDSGCFEREAESGILLDACPYPIYALRHGPDAQVGGHSVSFVWRTPTEGFVQFDVPIAHLNAKSADFAKTIGAGGLALAPDRIERVKRMAIDWANAMFASTKQVPVSNTFGWDPAGGDAFTLGDVRYVKGDAQAAQVRAAVGAEAQPLVDAYKPWGTREGYDAAMDVAARNEDLWPTLFASLVSLSAPLWIASDLQGATVNFYNQQSGTGKSLALRAASAVWGHPEGLWAQAQNSLVAISRVLSIHHTLPCCIDEVSTIKPETMCDLLYMVSWGREKQRLTQAGRVIPSGSWSTVMLMSSNPSMRSKLAQEGVATTGQMNRTFEISVSVPDDQARKEALSADARAASAGLFANHGHIGQEWARTLAQWGREAVAGMVASWTAAFDARWQGEFRGDERYWAQVVRLAWIAGRQAQALGLIRYDPDAVVERAIAELPWLRQAAHSLVLGPYALLSRYLQETARHYVIVAKVLNARGNTETLTLTPPVQNPIHSRLDLTQEGLRGERNPKTTHAVLTVDRNHLRAWLDSMGYELKDLLGELRKDGVVVHTAQKRSMGKYIKWAAPGMTSALVLDCTKSEHLLDQIPESHELASRLHERKNAEALEATG